jgi:mRNA interferase MazF
LNRGDVYLIHLEPTIGSEQQGTRPAVIVSRDSLNAISNRVTIVPLTTFRHRLLSPQWNLIRQRPGGLQEDSVALCDQIRAVDKSRLERRLVTLRQDEMDGIDRALRVALSLDTSLGYPTPNPS